MNPEEKRDPDIVGTIEDVVYHNPANDYAVLELIDDRTGKLVTAVGTVPYAAAGEQMRLFGIWKEHTDYGRQLLIESYERALPTEGNDLLRYLSSGAIKGVGPSTALKIVNRFGLETFDVIEKHPEWLTDIPGITRKKAAAIATSFQEQAGLRELMTICAGRVGSAVVTRAFREWGRGAAGLLRADPYRLCRDGFGVSFARADEIAASLGVSPEAEVRVRAGISYVLSYNASVNGHTCLPYAKLVAAAADTLGLTEEQITTALDAMMREERAVLRSIQGQKMVFSAENDKAEENVAQTLLSLSRHAVTLDRQNLVGMIRRMETEWGIEYAPAQREAIGQALSNGVMILTGGPGTGKTTVIRALIRIFDLLDMDTVLAAPTGRAAKRMSEATVHEAKTLHRLLEMMRDKDILTPHFARNREHPLDAMVVIVDECSMIDLPLMNALCNAMRRGSRLILVGDADQLPAVGCGNILGDLIGSGGFPTVRLTEIFRQAQESLIVTNAHRILRGEMPILDRNDSDFFFLGRAREEAIPTTVEELLAVRLPRAYGKEAAEGIQVITPTHRGVSGTENLNLRLQERLNPPAKGKAEIRAHGVTFRVGDKVMQVKNRYDVEWKRGDQSGTGVFNGDLGVILAVEKTDTAVTVSISFDGRVAEYDPSMLEEVEHAYAVTVHKSQGSEYPTVVLPVCSCGSLLQTRNLLYTAMTRAKERLILVGREDILRQMVENVRKTERYTGLRDRLTK
ncbi:MAG: ATP-dependent RecD-like DNA helicase [Clostridia bacterium]|nr:ATP-dependent RecD-like DNA helicase [Clostridia bacterium]MDY6184817.1 ATP-dependent RecD-like DNA helicase [Eubacteriales bacterium]